MFAHLTDSYGLASNEIPVSTERSYRAAGKIVTINDNAVAWGPCFFRKKDEPRPTGYFIDNMMNGRGTRFWLSQGQGRGDKMYYLAYFRAMDADLFFYTNGPLSEDLTIAFRW